MLIKLTNQVVDIEPENIKEIQKKSILWDAGWNDDYISIEYKTGSTYKIKCRSKEEVEKDYNIIVNLLEGKKNKIYPYFYEDYTGLVMHMEQLNKMIEKMGASVSKGCDFCNNEKEFTLKKGLDIGLSNNKLIFCFDAYACGYFEDELKINYCPMCGKKLA